MAQGAQTQEFRAEVSALLKLVTGSLYANREVFLRELLSNASDALDKARFQALVDEAIREGAPEPKILITSDKQRGTLTIEDNGIGMNRDEASLNLGTIAHSGTLRFLEEARNRETRPDIGLIGQFGVGFYSAFMVSDLVEVETLSAQPHSEPVLWTSRGEGGFDVLPGHRKERGTAITLHLANDAKEYLERWWIESCVRRWSNFVMHPIHLRMVDEKGEIAAEEPKINAASAFWLRAAKDLSDGDYTEFYRHVMGGFVMPGDEPIARLHLAMEAPIQFNALLYVPGRAPLDLFQEDRKALQLYARRILVMENCDSLLPPYLRFFRGVVDSEDLPLNVSREMLQENQTLAAIRRQITRKAIKLLEDLATENPARYDAFWAEFGLVFKEGVHNDGAHRKELTELLRWPTVEKGDAWISLAQYLAAMPSDQEAIHYIAGEDARRLRTSPQLEALRARGQDVFVMTDPVDEWVLQSLREYCGKSLRSVTASAVESEDDRIDGDLAPLLIAAREVLRDRVRDVRSSSRLIGSPACLVDDSGALSRNMERILRAAQRTGDATTTKRVLELNPVHSFVKKANHLAVEAPNDPRVAEWIELLHDLANLAEGEIPDPAAAVARFSALLEKV